MTTEDDFQRALDAHPNDYQTRLVFADWLEEQGDARAEGYRALGVNGWRTRLDRSGGPWGCRDSNETWIWWKNIERDELRETALPPDWFELVVAAGHYISDSVTAAESKDFYTRRAAEDAAAIAFAKLPAERRAELLNSQPAEAP